MSTAVRQRVLWSIAGAVWIVGIAAGLRELMAYDNRPGLAANAPGEWPRASRLIRDYSGPTLVMLAHPKCDCTRASLTELEELLARAPRRPRTYVVFIRPGRVPGGWEQTALWRRAAGIAGVTVLTDDNGAEAQRFGAHTSGQTLLYDAGGRLLYAGGATGARGKTGDNAGRASILAALSGDPLQKTAPVFGCAIFSPDDAPADDAPPAQEHASHVR